MVRRSKEALEAVRNAKLAEEALIAKQLAAGEALKAAESASLAEIEGVVDTLEVHDDPAIDTAGLDALEVRETQATEQTEQPSFLETVAALDDDKVLAMTFSLTSNLDQRAAQERLDHPENDSIQKNLEKARKVCTTKRTAAVLLACGVEDAGFVNRVWHDGSYFNVYAMSTKLASIRETLLEGVPLSNEINRAVITSMFRLQKAGIGFDFELAKAAASDKYTVKTEGARKHLVRHTVGASTASTQAGSTMHMLAAMGIVTIQGRGKNPAYTINETPATKRLREVLLAA